MVTHCIPYQHNRKREKGREREGDALAVEIAIFIEKDAEDDAVH
jgi:hypothetical protein